MDKQVLQIEIPPLSVPRLYLYSFLHFVSAIKRETARYIELESYDILGEVMDGIRTVTEILEKREKESPNLSKIPMSGNDKKIFQKVCSEFKCDLNSIVILKTYQNILEQQGIQRLINGVHKFEVPQGYALPSIFKLEFYGQTRGTFFKDGFKIDPKISTDFLLLLLAGYLVSRVARTRINREDWISVQVLPVKLVGWKKTTWKLMLEDKLKSWYGVKPVDAAILHMLVNLWDVMGDEQHDLLVLGISDPRASKPAEPAVTIYAPLREIYVRAHKMLEKVLGEEAGKNAMIRLLKRALDVNQPSREIAEKFVKLIFLSIQGDIRALEELSLMSSRLEIRTLTPKQARGVEEEVLNVARDARRIAGRILEAVSELVTE
jgi:hypothetical protein